MTDIDSFVKQDCQLLEPLVDETLRLKNRNPFGRIIELTGEHLEIDDLIFKPNETELVIKNNFLVMKNFANEPFMLLELPDLRLLRTFGRRGQGPDEFSHKHICPHTNPNILATVVSNRGEIYDILPDGILRPYSVNLRRSTLQGEYFAYEPGLMTDSLLYFVANSPTGKSIFTFDVNSAEVEEIQNLALNPRRRGWANYVGSFAVNAKQNRMVYAYKYYKMLKFFDTEHNTVRTLNFEKEELDESTLTMVDGMDQNVTHYWKIYATEKYVYLSYSGRKPADVWIENRRGIHYILIEKYDWNGNPIAKYRLDQWGWHFAVDEKNNLLYLVSTNHDDPFFRFRLD